MPDDHSEVVPLLPIPNRTVKRFCADDSADSRVKVGHRQAIKPKNAQPFGWAFSFVWHSHPSVVSVYPSNIYFSTIICFFYSSGVFIKVTRSGPRRYVQLVEAYRDDDGQPRQRTVATLGRLDQMGAELESVISGLMRVTGKSPPNAEPAPVVAFEPARDFGDVWTLTELWNSLGFDRLRKVFLRTRHAIDVE